MNARRLKKVEWVQLYNSIGRVCSKTLLAPFPYPSFTNSAMDGYAFYSLDTKNAQENKPVKLRIQNFISAGSPVLNLTRGSAMVIATGAPLPRRANTVLPQERAYVQNEELVFSRFYPAFQHVRMQGENVKKGEILIAQGMRIQSKHIGLCASFGINYIEVFKKPRVYYFATGTELVSTHRKKKDYQIYNSNSASLEVLFKEQNTQFINLGICKDTLSKTVCYLKRALSYKPHFLVMTGGVSVGHHDYIKEALNEIGALILFHKVALKPGKPILCARFKKTLIFGLPGNPLSAHVGFYQFIIPALSHMLHQKKSYTEIVAKLKDKLCQIPRHQFLCGIHSQEENGDYTVTPLPSGSGDVSVMARSTCFISLPPGKKNLKKGSVVTIQPY